MMSDMKITMNDMKALKRLCGTLQNMFWKWAAT